MEEKVAEFDLSSTLPWKTFSFRCSFLPEKGNNSHKICQTLLALQSAGRLALTPNTVNVVSHVHMLFS